MNEPIASLGVSTDSRLFGRVHDKLYGPPLKLSGAQLRLCEQRHGDAFATVARRYGNQLNPRTLLRRNTHGLIQWNLFFQYRFSLELTNQISHGAPRSPRSPNDPSKP